jgi:hypothetical protein
MRVEVSQSQHCDDLHISWYTSVNIVTHKQIICIGYLSTNFEQLHQIMELTVDVSADDHWCSHRLYI